MVFTVPSPTLSKLPPNVRKFALWFSLAIAGMAYGANPPVGAAYIYVWNGVSWISSQQAPPVVGVGLYGTDVNGNFTSYTQTQAQTLFGGIPSGSQLSITGNPAGSTVSYVTSANVSTNAGGTYTANNQTISGLAIGPGGTLTEGTFSGLNWYGIVVQAPTQVGTGTGNRYGLYLGGNPLSSGPNYSIYSADSGATAYFAGQITATGGLTVGTSTLLTSNVALTNGAAASAGTLTNAPAIGNPTKWIPINDNGTTRYIPAW